MCRVDRRSRCSRSVPTDGRPSARMDVTARRTIAGASSRVRFRFSGRPAGTARRRCRTGLRGGSACRRALPRCRCGRSAPASRSRATSASMSSTMKWMRFQPPGPGWVPSGIGRPAELARSREQQAQVAPLDVSERGRRARQHLEAKLLRVERDRLVDVVDHVADIDRLIVRHMLTSSSMVLPADGAGIRSASRARSPVRSKAGKVARSFGPSSAGSGTLQCTRSGCDGNSGQTSLTRSHSVTTTSKGCATNSSTMLGAVPADVDPALPHHADCVGMQRLRMTPGRRSCDCSLPTSLRAAPLRSANARCSRCTGTRPAASGAAHASRCDVLAVVPRPATARDAARRRRLAAAPGTPRDRPCSSCRGDRRNCDARRTSPPARS